MAPFPSSPRRRIIAAVVLYLATWLLVGGWFFWGTPDDPSSPTAPTITAGMLLGGGLVILLGGLGATVLAGGLGLPPAPQTAAGAPGDLPLPLLEGAQRLDNLQWLQPGLVHELKNPLNAMVINLSLLHHGLSAAGALDERRSRYLAILKSEVERLNERLDFALGLLAPAEATPVDLVAVAAEVERLVGPHLRRHSIGLTVSSPSSPLVVAGQWRDWRDVVLRLVILAAEALSKDDHLTLELSPWDSFAQLTLDPGEGVRHGLRRPRGDSAGLDFTWGSLCIDTAGGRLTLHTKDSGKTVAKMRLPLVSAPTGAPNP